MVRDAFLKEIPYDIAKHLIRDALNMQNFDELFNLACAWSALDNSIKKGAPTINLIATLELERCSYCKYKGHSSNECRRKKKDEAHNFSKPAHSLSAPSSNQLTFKASNANPANIHESKLPLQTKPFGPKLGINQICFLRTGTRPANESTINSVTQHSVNIPNQNAKKLNRSIEFILRINSIEVTAMLDTGAKASLMSSDTAKQLNLMCEETSMQLQPFDKSIIVTPAGIVKQAHIQMGSQREKIDFFVIKELSSSKILLGMDFFDSFNLYIGDIKLNFAKDNQLPMQQTHQEDYNCSAHQDSCKREHILEAIAPLIQENKSTLKSFCNHPESVVTLDTGTNPPSWVPQCHIAKHLHAKVDT